MDEANQATTQSNGDAGCVDILKPCGFVADGEGDSKKTSVSFDVGIASFPYLADHGFQDMVVLPGAFYVELALRVHRESLQAAVAKIKQIEFLNPVILSAGNVTFPVEAGWLDEKTVQYKIYESNGADRSAVAGRLCAILEIEDGILRQAGSDATIFPVAAFQQRAVYLGDREKFYQSLRANGNQYGPQFQNLLHVWRVGDEALGRLRVHRPAAGTRHYLDPVLVDGAIQLLAAFFLDQGRTFILQGIEGITLFQPDFPAEMWVHAKLRPSGDATGNGGIGDVDVFDDAGLCRLKLQGVRFTYLERQETREVSEPSKTRMVVAATFTAEPVEDALQFWGGHLEFPVQVSFAPYNQVFQELLNPASQMRRNQEGVNVMLLNLDDWAAPGRSTGLKTDPEKVAANFDGLARHVLPNGLLPIIAMIGLDIGYFMSGIVVVESVFGWPGIGQLTWQAIQQIDIPIIMGVTLVAACAIVLGNLLADLVAPLIDPRIKLK